jgi:tyrosine-protein phosphatase SIW14
MPRIVRYLLATFIVVLLVGGPLGYLQLRRQHLRNVHVVREGVLYRSGQLSPYGLQRLLHDYGIRTVISLRFADNPGERPPDWEEEEYCRKRGLNYHRIQPRRWWASDGSVPAEAGVRRFLDILDDPKNHPVLIHCFAGAHRTGSYCAIFRMEYDGWSNADAIAEMKRLGYDNLDDEWDVISYLEQYRPRQARTPLPAGEETAEPPRLAP